MADENKKSTGKTILAKRTVNLGSKKDGSPKISVKRGDDLGSLSKDDQDIYRKYKIIY